VSATSSFAAERKAVAIGPLPAMSIALVAASDTYESPSLTALLRRLSERS
jgi:hypothetical protein